MTAALSYLGHCAFLWETDRGRKILVDPFGNSPTDHWFSQTFPPVETDAVAVTHQHFDHSAIDGLPGSPTILRGAGEFRLDDISVRGIADLHSGESGRRGLRNTMFVVEASGVRFCHIGDNRHDIPDGVVTLVGTVDVLMVTVDDSCHLLSYQEVDGLIARLSPRVVVPMHYCIPGLTTKESTLKTPDGWIATRSAVRRLGSSCVRLTPESLPDETEVWMFDARLA